MDIKGKESEEIEKLDFGEKEGNIDFFKELD